MGFNDIHSQPSEKKGAISKVIYKKKKQNSENLNTISNALIREQLKKTIAIESQLEYQLIFDKEASRFELIDNLNPDDTSSLVLLAKGFKEIYYFNVKDKLKIRYTEATGQSFNVSIPLNTYNWKISDSCKYIKGYLCYKAVGRFEFYNPMFNRRQVFTPVAWFTPEIKVPFGPNGLDGLPGLILEGSLNGKSYFYADHIELQTTPPDPIKFELPNGISITDDEYRKILLKFLKSKQGKLD